MIEIKVTVRGPLFDKKIEGVVKDAIIEETIGKIGDRLMRKGEQGSGGRGLGVKRNVVTSRRDEMTLRVFTSRKFPRTKGTAWQRKNVAIAKAMAPFVLRKTARRIVSELGGS